MLVRYAGAFWQVLGDAIVGRTATVIMVALLATLIAMGCASERPPSPRKNAEPPVVVAAGDIAGCDTEGDEATARLVRDISDATVLTLGDNAYPDGSIENFHECYGPTWGWFKERTNPTPGNHEYHTEGAKGYFDYFLESAGDPDEGYYSFDLGAWHLVALNSNCEEVGGCGASSPQVRWLKADLAKDDESCTMAYFHHPLFTSGEYRPGIREVRPLWKALYAARVDVVLNGHDHNYQRFSPQDPSGKVDPERGIREFVVGSGGRSHYEIRTALANSEVHNDDTYGVLKLTLKPSSYDWEFVPVRGQSFTDSGNDSCH